MVRCAVNVPQTPMPSCCSTLFEAQQQNCHSARPHMPADVTAPAKCSGGAGALPPALLDAAGGAGAGPAMLAALARAWPLAGDRWHPQDFVEECAARLSLAVCSLLILYLAVH